MLVHNLSVQAAFRELRFAYLFQGTFVRDLRHLTLCTDIYVLFKSKRTDDNTIKRYTYLDIAFDQKIFGPQCEGWTSESLAIY